MKKMTWGEVIETFYSMLDGRKWKWAAWDFYPALDDREKYMYSIICEPKDLFMVRYPRSSDNWYYPDPFRHAHLEEGEFKQDEVEGVSYVFPPVTED